MKIFTMNFNHIKIMLHAKNEKLYIFAVNEYIKKFQLLAFVIVLLYYSNNFIFFVYFLFKIPK